MTSVDSAGTCVDRHFSFPFLFFGTKPHTFLWSKKSLSTHGVALKYPAMSGQSISKNINTNCCIVNILKVLKVDGETARVNKNDVPVFLSS